LQPAQRMTAIVKTLPAWFARGQIDKFLTARFVHFYFTLGRGRPRIQPASLFLTHKGVLLGSFDVEEVCRNEGQLPKLTTLDGEPSDWQIKPDRYVAVCAPPFHRLEEQLCHVGFRGWRYFDLEAYRKTLDSRVTL